MSYEHRLVEAANGREFYDKIGREADETIAAYNRRRVRLEKKIAAQAEALKVAVEALKWYGNCGGVPFQDDSHERANAALSRIAALTGETK